MALREPEYFDQTQKIIGVRSMRFCDDGTDVWSDGIRMVGPLKPLGQSGRDAKERYQTSEQSARGQERKGKMQFAQAV